MKAYQFLKTAMFTTGIILIPAALAGDGVTVGVPDDEAPVVEKVKGGEKPAPTKDVIVLPDETVIPIADMWPKLYEIMRDRNRNAAADLQEVLKQHDWTPEEIYEIVRTTVIANPSIGEKIDKILEEAGVDEDVIREVIDKLREDDAILEGGVHIAEEYPIIPTPEPVTDTH